MTELTLIVVTPERTVLEQTVDFLALPLYDGEIGIASGRSPMIGRIGCGEMRLGWAKLAERYYIEGGFVEVLGNTVSILTNRARRASQIEVSAAQEQLAAARRRPSNTPELMSIRDRAIDQSRAQLRVARRAVSS